MSDYTESVFSVSEGAMSSKSKLFARVKSVSSRIAPQVDKTWRDVRKRLDALNGSLASRAVPEVRKATVSDLSLRAKGEKAGQNTDGEDESGS
ncbi:hypothetical protein, partial [Marinobacter sp.]|uniref:hypothetical protein n=1 Tax=Marinobacter sp. TaxID=50741 RepID=UPI002B2791B7